jgi:protein-S-isoprenylcysteine O-methyltransferase Ste14
MQRRRCICVLSASAPLTISSSFSVFAHRSLRPVICSESFQQMRDSQPFMGEGRERFIRRVGSGGQKMSEIHEQEADISGRQRTVRIHPPLLAAGLLIIVLVLHLISGNHQYAFSFHQLFGLLLVAAGSGFSSYAAALFSARNTTRNPYGEPTAFVVVSPYTITRNPMYVGLAAILFGFATFFGSPVMLLAPIAFVIIIDRTVIPNEEATMERLYGQQYRDYKNRVSRWLLFPS